MPYIPPPSVRFWCVICDRPYWYVPGVGTFRTSSYHNRPERRDRNRETWPKALCQDHYELAVMGVDGYREIQEQALRLEEYYQRKYGKTWRRKPRDQREPGDA